MFLRYGAEFEPPATAFLDACGESELRRIRALIDRIRDNPTVDEREIIAIVVPPIVFRVLVKDGYWIVFHLRGFEAWILAITRGIGTPTASDVLAIRRREAGN